MTADPALGAVLYVWSDPLDSSQVVNELWRWDGANWVKLDVAGPLPEHTSVMQSASGDAGALAYDGHAHRLVFFNHVGGVPATWTFDGGTWEKAATTSGTTSSSFDMVWNEATSSIVLFGSNGDTWTWNGTKWNPQSPVHSPGPRTGASLAYDPVKGQVVLFGGHTAAGDTNDLWAWDGSDWGLIENS